MPEVPSRKFKPLQRHEARQNPEGDADRLELSMVEVNQSDREAAWPHRPSCYKPADKWKWDDGIFDKCDVIQAFARHRHQSGRTGDREGVKNVGCNYCGAKVALMGADYLEQLADALDKVGAPRKSPDGNEHYGLEKRIAALGEGRTGAGEALQEAAGAVLSAIYGADIDPFAEPEKWEFAEGVAKSVLAALSQSTAGEDET